MIAPHPHPLLDGSPYRSYVYGYPHKTAYRPLDPPVPLAPLWAAERRDALSLYIHIPFCGMRCGFCNLFTRAGADASAVARYLDALRSQADRVASAVGTASYARFALGGGTPTYLDPAGLEAVFAVAGRTMGVDLAMTPTSVEVSPGTVDPDRLAVLVGHGVDRISIGVESFDEAEAAAVLRPQKLAEVERALTLIRDSGVPTLNVDLIYGLPGQTVASWLGSIRAALRFRPEELYLYPLYVRPLTGLDRQGKSWDDHRLACYRAGRDLLISEGYEQVSMRMFRRGGSSPEAGPVYCCQDDGMVGLGAGARSYTTGLHYASEYAVGARGVRAILDDYATRPAEAFDLADFGRHLAPDDRRRRFVLQSILQVEGLDLVAYFERFGTAAEDDLPELRELVDLGLAEPQAGKLALTAAGLERSDAIGPWLFSAEVQRTMEDYEWR